MNIIYEAELPDKLATNTEFFEQFYRFEKGERERVPPFININEDTIKNTLDFCQGAGVSGNPEDERNVYILGIGNFGEEMHRTSKKRGSERNCIVYTREAPESRRLWNKAYLTSADFLFTYLLVDKEVVKDVEKEKRLRAAYG